MKVHQLSSAIAEGEKTPKGLLSGMSIGIKDIFDTTDMPTQWGTSYMYSPSAQAYASFVASLKKATGASSSGSAAADGMLCAAIGSLTSGSIIRPASFCSVVGLKPSPGLSPNLGVKAFCKSLDTVRVNAPLKIENLPLDNDARALLKKSFYAFKKMTSMAAMNLTGWTSLFTPSYQQGL